ncbi:MAG TPA: hypothetical protein VGL75_13215 [Acidothermaceae bacterium]|jgi:hypothetical protein
MAKVVLALVGGLVLLLACAVVPLAVATRDPWPVDDGLGPALFLVFAGIGFVIARRQPRNPVGWILVAVALVALIQTNAALYTVLDYRLHHGDLPFGAAAVYWSAGYALLPLIIGLPAIALFPDGRLSRRWRRFMQIYVVLAVIFSAAQFVEKSLPSGQRPEVNLRGRPTNIDVASVAGFAWLLAPFFLAAWASFVVHQVRRWRSSNGVEREQLKWLMAGSGICLLSGIAIVLGGDPTTSAARAIADLCLVGIGAMPISIGVGILRYRLYEIDRLISRTISYAIVTGLVVGVFVGTVVLTSRVLPFSSPVGVAASTLVVAALFTPLRSRVQRLVDRSFNRASYNTDAIVVAFSARLRDAIDLETIRVDLLKVVNQAVAPAHVSVWMPPGAEATLATASATQRTTR